MEEFEGGWSAGSGLRVRIVTVLVAAVVVVAIPCGERGYLVCMTVHCLEPRRKWREDEAQASFFFRCVPVILPT